MYAKALLPLDGSAFSRAAIAHVTKLSPPEVVIVEVIDTITHLLDRAAPSELSVSIVEQVVDAERGAARTHIEEAADELRASGIAQVSTVVRDGSPGATIVGVAHELGCDVIVMSTHGRSGLKRAIVGSVADYVVHHAREAAVLLIRPSDDADDDPD